MVLKKTGLTKGKQTVQYSPKRVEVAKRWGTHTSRIAPDWWEKELKGGKETPVCGRCQAIYFDKHWHTMPEVYEWLKKQKGKGSLVTGLCGECELVKRAGSLAKEGWEGEVILDGLILGEEKNNILNTVRNVGKRATSRDPEDQIIKIDDQGSRVVIRTTENQLAVSIGKQVARAFKGGELTIKYSHEDAPVRVYWKHK